MKKCPCCFEDITEELKKGRCPFCDSFVENSLINLNFPSVNRKRCYFCGNSVASEAKYCRYCHKSLEDVEENVRLLKELEEEDNAA